MSKKLSAAELKKRGSWRALKRSKDESAAAKAAKPSKNKTAAAGEQVAVIAPELTAPPKPDWLDAEAGSKWDELIPILEAMRVLTCADGDTCARYCHAWASWRQADRLIRKQGITIKSGSGNIKTHPAVTVRAQMDKIIRECGDRLGLSPDARRLLNVAAIFVRSQPIKPKQSDPEPAGQAEVIKNNKEKAAPIQGEDFFKQVAK